MSALEKLLVAVALVMVGWLGVHHYGAERYEAGHAAAVAAGEKLRHAEVERNHETESALRAQLHAADADAFKKEQEYASNLEAAQRRVRAGVDGLRCPAASTVQPGASAGDRPAAAGLARDGAGSAIVPEVAAEILGDGAAVAGLVRRFERLEQRFDKCQAVNAK